MERVVATLAADGRPVPYCTVWFREASYSCLTRLRDDALVGELIAAGRRLRARRRLFFPCSDMPALSSILRKIRVVEADGEGLLWWPTHLQSGSVPALDAAIAEAVIAKGTLAASFDWQGSDERLLLLVAEARGLTDLVGRAREIELPSYPTLPFTWVVVWDRFSEDIWTIFPRHAVICDGSEQVRRPWMLPEALRRFATGGERYPTRPKAR